MASNFVGNSLSLSSEVVQAVTASLGVKAAELWSVLEVETSGCGFLPDRRPQVLFERHVFYRLTKGKYKDPEISNPVPGGYGAGGAHQYERIEAAMAMDRVAALKSASWGLGQVMGHNFASAGFSDVDTFVRMMSDSEDFQLKAMSLFIIGKGLHVALASHDWSAFARGYNGAGYAKNQYDARLRGSFQRYSYGALPDLDVRAAQLYLMYSGFHPGPIDGNLGRLTRSALVEFKSKFGLDPNESINPSVLEKLREIAVEEKHKVAKI